MIDASKLIGDARRHISLRMDEWAHAAGVGRATLGRIASRHIPNPGLNTMAKAVAPTGVPLWVFIKSQEEQLSVAEILEDERGGIELWKDNERVIRTETADFVRAYEESEHEVRYADCSCGGKVKILIAGAGTVLRGLPCDSCSRTYTVEIIREEHAST